MGVPEVALGWSEPSLTPGPVIVCVMHPADVELGKTVPVEVGPDVLVMGLKPRRSRFDAMDVGRVPGLL